MYRRIGICHMRVHTAYVIYILTVAGMAQWERFIIILYYNFFVFNISNNFSVL